MTDTTRDGSSPRGRAARHPHFFVALKADARLALAYRGERFRMTSTSDGVRQVLRLLWSSDAFLGLALYRFKARCQGLGIPILPRIAHRLAMSIAQVCIGDPVVVAPGIYLAHGQVVIDGITEVEAGAVFFPWVTVGLRAGVFEGPRIGPNVQVGTGAKIIGPITVGEGVMVGANAVVVEDVPHGVTVVGIPARVVG